MNIVELKGKEDFWRMYGKERYLFDGPLPGRFKTYYELVEAMDEILEMLFSNNSYPQCDAIAFWMKNDIDPYTIVKMYGDAKHTLIETISGDIWELLKDMNMSDKVKEYFNLYLKDMVLKKVSQDPSGLNGGKIIPYSYREGSYVEFSPFGNSLVADLFRLVNRPTQYLMPEGIVTIPFDDQMFYVMSVHCDMWDDSPLGEFSEFVLNELMVRITTNAYYTYFYHPDK